MPVDIFILMFGYMLVSSFTPGPGNILALNTMMNYGWKKGKQLIMGIGLGYFVVQYICTVAVYFLSIYLKSVTMFIKYAGAIYLVWLAIHIILSKAENQSDNKKANFITGFLLQLVNVKIYFYCITLLSVYIVPYFESALYIILMGLFVILVGCSATLTWAFLGVKLQKFYMSHFKVCNIVLGLFLLYCAYTIIWS